MTDLGVATSTRSAHIDGDVTAVSSRAPTVAATPATASRATSRTAKLAACPLAFGVIASGSSGNAAVIRAGDTTVLVDVGVSAARIERALESWGLALTDLDAILITHAHADHVCHLPGVLKRLIRAEHKVSVFATEPVLQRLARLLTKAAQPAQPNLFSARRRRGRASERRQTANTTGNGNGNANGRGIPASRSRTPLSARTIFDALDIDGATLQATAEDDADALEAAAQAVPQPTIAVAPAAAIKPERFLDYLARDTINPGSMFGLGAIDVLPVRTHHDAPGCVAFAFRAGARRVGIFTDSGEPTEDLRIVLPMLDAVLLESNHDEQRLNSGPYPFHLKKRILSPHGHLSNRTAAMLVADRAGERLRTLVLGHLSRENNTPLLALELFHDLLHARRRELLDRANISVAEPGEHGAMVPV